MPENSVKTQPKLSASLPELPNNLFAEKAALVKILRKDDNWDVIVGEISTEDFFDQFHRRVFEAMNRIADSGKKIGFQSVSATLQEIGAFPSEANEQRLDEIWAYPMMGDIMADIETIRAKSKLRELIGTAETIIHEAYKQDEETVYDFLDSAEDQIANIAENRGFEIDALQIQGYISLVQERLDYIREHGKAQSGVYSGFKAIDDVTRGFNKSDLIVIAARPGVGKTTISLNIAEHVVLKDESPGRVVFFTLEQPGEQLLLKMVASISGIDHNRLRSDRLTLEEETKVQSATGQLLGSGDRLLLDQSSHLTVHEIRSRTKNIERKVGAVDLVIVDYLQLMSTADQKRSYDTRTLEVAQMTRGLKHLAMDLKLPVVILSQLNRKSTERKSAMPILADLRDSGAIEQDADLVLLLHREDLAHGEGAPVSVTDVHIAKHRHGPTGRKKLVFDGRFGRFRAYTSDDGPSADDIQVARDKDFENRPADFNDDLP